MIIIQKGITVGLIGFPFTQWYIYTDSTLAEATSAGFINYDNTLVPPELTSKDFAWLATSDAATLPVQVSISNNIITLNPYDAGDIVLAGDPTDGLTVTENSPSNWTISLSQNLSTAGSPTFAGEYVTSLSGFSNATYALVKSSTSNGELSSVTPSSTMNLYLSNGSLGNPEWTTVNLSGSGISGVLPVANGGTNSSTALNNNLLMVSNGGSIVEINQDTSAGGYKLTNLADPTQAQDAVTKYYADNLLYNFSVKASCVAATTTALPTCVYNNGILGVGATLTASSNAALTAIDTVTLAVGERVLVKNQADTAQNGIYTLTDAGSVSSVWVMTRATDFDNVESMTMGSSTYISDGDENLGTTWALNTEVTVVGTSSIVFAQIGGAAAVTILGTTNQINVNQVGSVYTLSTPQDIATSSSPTFSTVTLSGLTARGVVTLSSSNVAQTVSPSTSGNILTSNGTDWVSAAPATSGTVTSVAMTVPSFLSVSGSPITSSGTLAVSLSGTALPVLNGGTGETSYTDGQLLIGNSTGNTLTKATLTGTANQVTVTNGSGSITLALPQSIATSSSPTFTGLNLSGLTASYAVVTDGSKNLASLAYSTSSTASTLVQRDSNANSSSNRYIPNSNVESLSGTKTLVAGDAQYQFLNPNGSNRTVQLPTGVTNMLFIIQNTGSAGNTLTVQNASAVQVGNPISNSITVGFFYNGSSWLTV